MLAGLAVFLASGIFSSFISGKYSRLEVLINKTKDARIKMMNEILNGIKVIIDLYSLDFHNLEVH